MEPLDLLNTYFRKKLRGSFIKKAILSFTDYYRENLIFHKWDVNLKNGRLYYGYDKNHYIWLLSLVGSALIMNGNAVIMLRSFLNRYDKKTKLPIKEIRAFILKKEESIKINYVKAEEVKWEENHDPITGKELEPEEAVFYCDESKCII
ncbi:MAG: hypothetical protein ACP5I6_06335 [Caldisphaera sp.]